MGLLFSELAEHKTVKAAAAAMAGNWTHWSCFVWFGSKEVRNSDTEVMLGYLVNHESTLRQLANLEFIKAELAEWWGDMTKGALVGDFGSSFCGDKDMLSGLMLRVYQDGKITEPFRKLYITAKLTEADGQLICDDATFERVRRREMLAYVHRYLEHECRERGVEFSAELAEQITDSMISNEVDYDNDDMDAEIASEMGWVELCETCDEPMDVDCSGKPRCPVCDGPCPQCDDGGAPI